VDEYLLKLIDDVRFAKVLGRWILITVKALNILGYNLEGVEIGLEEAISTLEEYQKQLENKVM